MAEAYITTAQYPGLSWTVIYPDDIPDPPITLDIGGIPHIETSRDGANVVMAAV